MWKGSKMVPALTCCCTLPLNERLLPKRFDSQLERLKYLRRILYGILLWTTGCGDEPAPRPVTPPHVTINQSLSDSRQNRLKLDGELVNSGAHRLAIVVPALEVIRPTRIWKNGEEVYLPEHESFDDYTVSMEEVTIVAPGEAVPIHASFPLQRIATTNGESKVLIEFGDETHLEFNVKDQIEMQFEFPCSHLYNVYTRKGLFSIENKSLFDDDVELFEGAWTHRRRFSF